MKKLRYHLVDVFTDRQFGGNPLAVFTDGTGLSTETMQSIAKEMNLSETTFVLPPEDAANNFRVRIFTPTSELPMAGHPTVGTTHVLARERMIESSTRENAQGTTTIRLEEGVGMIPVEIEWRNGAPDFIEMTQPSPDFGPRFDDAAALAEMLSLDRSAVDTRFPPEVVSCGVPFLFVPLRSLAEVRACRVRIDLMEKWLGGFASKDVFVFTTGTEFAGSGVHSRMFAPLDGIPEDPATGGASGPLGCYLVRHNVIASDAELDITSEQGIEMGRPSFIRIRIRHDGSEKITRVRVGGRCRYMGGGHLELED
ncbi:MAG: trans-2,3-dihydro-3-hydroxyanthranilate isomerase [Acidobacteriota bacterium]|jgi:trans-2,3-dihydro-3-hydroxyanthranilate isomerase|nr:trans-2,3-dihydro-3-hydroxyanthranilate isomerase [Acidobacteriota bacterium]